MLQRHALPDFFSAGDVIAGACGVVGADIIGLEFEASAECIPSRGLQVIGEGAAGRDATQQKAAVEDAAADTAKQSIHALFSIMAHRYVPEFMPDDDGQVGFAARHA